MLIVNVDGGTSIRLDHTRILAAGALSPLPGEEVLDAGGGAVIPGLHDHHVHLRAMAAALASVDVGPPLSADSFARRLRDAHGDGWIRAVGYHESVAGSLDRLRLDAIVLDRPVRVQHRSGTLWVLNTAALDRVGARNTHGTGRLWRRDRWLADRIPPAPLDFSEVGRRAAAAGIVAFTDADPSRTPADVDRLIAADLPQRLTLMSSPYPQVGVPRKLILDDATLPPLDDLTTWFRAAHDAGDPVAVHCVTRLQIVVTTAALTDADDGWRRGDRIEHGGVIPPELFPDLRRLGVTVVTQPNFVAERGDAWLTDVDPDDRPHLYPCASLRAAGIPVAASTDAPFGAPDPWAAMRAAVHRRTASGQVVGPDERVDAATALSLFLGEADGPGTPRRVVPGQPADLCILDRPLADVYAALDADDPGLAPVTTTIVGGEVVFSR